MEWGSGGVLEWWSIGVVECWSVQVVARWSITPSLQHSNTPPLPSRFISSVAILEAAGSESGREFSRQDHSLGETSGVAGRHACQAAETRGDQGLLGVASF